MGSKTNKRKKKQKQICFDCICEAASMGAAKSEMYNAPHNCCPRWAKLRAGLSAIRTEPQLVASGHPCKDPQAFTMNTVYVRLAENVPPLCSRHCNSRLSLLRSR